MNPIFGAILANVGSALFQGGASRRAADAQSQSAQAGIEEQQRQFDVVRNLMQPYVDAGGSAIGQQMALTGLGGRDAYDAAIRQIEQSPEFGALVDQGENAILQNAAATGGLRGGNVQGALAEFRPSMLSDLINQQYARLGGLSSIGQNAAAGVGNVGMQTGANVSNLMQQQGAAQAGGILGGASAASGLLGSAGQVLGGLSSGAFQIPEGENLFSSWGF